MIETKYVERAELLFDSNFRVYGLGNFDIQLDELAELLSLLDKHDSYGLKSLYAKLEAARMG